MLLIWFLLVAAMIAAYVILDGFDLGVGILHGFIAKTESERQMLIRCVGPVWDGNEVWLIAAGGTLYFAFPLLYASGFSGFYLPLMMVLWLFILRAVGIEFRSHSQSLVWKSFFDGCFFLSSALLVIFFGAAIGNVMRGVPLNATQSFFLPLWTNWRLGPGPGILDWYTCLMGLMALVALTFHGACYIVVKTVGDLQARARRCGTWLLPLLMIVTLISLAITLCIRPQLIKNYRHYPLLFSIPLGVGVSLLFCGISLYKKHDKTAFLCSCAYLALMLLGAAVAVYPNLLTSSFHPENNITVYNAASNRYAMSTGLILWGLGIIIAIGYFIVVYRWARGKVIASDNHE